MIAVARELVSARGALLKRPFAAALEHQIGGAPDVDLGYSRRRDCRLGIYERLTPTIALPAKHKSRGAGEMAPILTAKDVARRIAAKCAFVDERGVIGIRLEPAAAIVRQYGEQFRRTPRQKGPVTLQIGR